MTQSSATPYETLFIVEALLAQAVSHAETIPGLVAQSTLGDLKKAHTRISNRSSKIEKTGVATRTNHATITTP